MNATTSNGHLDGRTLEQGCERGKCEPQPHEDATDDAIDDATLDALALRLEAVYEKARASREFQNAVAIQGVESVQRFGGTDAEGDTSDHGDALTKFKATLTQHDEERRGEREEQGRQRLIADLQALDSVTTVSQNEKWRPNVAAALRANFRFWDRYLPKYVLGEISKEVGDLAERHLAQFTWLFVVEGDCLVALTANGFVEDSGRVVSIEGPGIVPLVARTHQPYCTGQVANGSDPYYTVFKNATRSEQAVPIVFQGQLLAVLNQESSFPGTFSPASAKALEQDAVRLIRQLLTLKAHKRGTYWNPDRHGWGFNHILDLTIHQLKQSMDWAGEAVHLTAWYADPLDETLFALATTGYGATFLKNGTIPLHDSFTGTLALKPNDTVEECSVGDPRLKRADVDRLMGLRKVRAVTVWSCSGPDGSAQPGMVLSFYAFDDEAAAALPDETQLCEIAHLLRQQVGGYAQLRPLLATAAMEQTIMECADSDDQLQKAAELVSHVLDSDAVTIFARPRGGSKELHVAACTVPLDISPCNPVIANPPLWENSLNASGYEAGDGTVTGMLASKPGFPVRINSPRSVAKLPEDWPRRPSHKVREYLPKTVSEYRRCVGFGVPGRQSRTALGVFRAIRSFDSKPYTLCELETLRAMAQACADSLRSWRDWIEYTRTSRLDRPDADDNRLNLPIPRTSTRPIRALAHEILVDVYKEIKRRLGDCVFEAAVLVERPENQEEPMQVLAFHWELGHAPPKPSDTLSFQKPRVPNATWSGLLDGRAAITFTLPPTEAEVAIRSGARVPFWTWCGRHRQRGILVVDLTQPVEFGTDLITDLHVAARKLAAVLAIAGSTVRHSGFLSETNPQNFLEELCRSLKAIGACLKLSPAEGVCSWWSVGTSLPPEFVTSEDAWLIPMIEFPSDRALDHEDAVFWGVQEGFTSTAYILRVPIRFGAEPVGEITVIWDTLHPPDADAARLDDTTLRSLRIRDILALWSLWTWSWRDRQPLQVRFQREAATDGVVQWVSNVSFVPSPEGGLSDTLMSVALESQV